MLIINDNDSDDDENYDNGDDNKYDNGDDNKLSAVSLKKGQ